MPDRHADITRRAPDLVEALGPDERDALARALADGEPATEAALARWEHARRHLGARLRADLPEARLLALYALSEDPLVLGPEEEAELEAARPHLEASLTDHPALHDVLARIRADRDAFEAAWAAPEPAALRSPRRSADRRAADRPAAPTPQRWAWRTAAAVAMAVFIALTVLVVQRDAGYETVRTAASETRALDLPDGTAVLLAENSTLEVLHREGAERRVRLSGGAVFDVVPSEVPFVVETASALTTVLGTTFSVRADVRETEVVLVSGAVSLASRAAPAEAVRLAPGERARVPAGAAPTVPARADVAEALAWTGTWYFQAEALGEIAARLRTHYGVQVEVPAALARERVTGTFDQGAPVAQTLHTLAAALGVRVEGDPASGFRLAPADG